MYNVMLVDDKKIILEGLELLINWEKLGYNIIYKAKNAQEALTAAKNNRIDLVITDIRMKGANGLELIEELKKTSSRMKYILMSAYSEFSYAKQGIDAGVCGYLIKPIDQNELVELLKKIKQEFVKNDKIINQINSEILEDFLIGAKNNLDAIDGCRTGVNCRYIRLIEFQDNDKINFTENRNDTIIKIKIPVENFFKKSEIKYIMRNVKNSLDFVVECGEEHYFIKNLLDRLLMYLDGEGFSSIIIQAGKICAGIENISESIKSLDELNNVFFYETDKRVFIYDNYAGRKYSSDIEANIEFSPFLQAIRKSDEERLSKYICELKKTLEAGCFVPNDVKLYISSQIYALKDNLEKENNDIIAKILYRWTNICRKTMCNIDNICDFLSDAGAELIQKNREIKAKRAMGIVGQAVDYVSEHYGDTNLNLKELSLELYINPVYLGKLFKEKMGENFLTYLTNLRIDKAKELLIKSDLQIHEIAKAVGFKDANYFYVKFQKAENTTPANYRKNHR